jgi:hypothetical protein
LVETAKLLTTEGRYFDSATTYDQIRRPPDPGAKVAEDVAMRSAGIAAGRVIPYGGTIVGILSSAARAGTSQQEAAARTAFALKVIKNVELAPGGRVEGSAFLPGIKNASALVVVWSEGRTQRRAVLPFRSDPNPQR